MAYATRSNRRYGVVGTGGSIGGIVGMYAALGLGLAILAFGAALLVTGDPAANQQAAAGGLLSLAIGLLPVIAAPILAVVAGLWAGTVTRSAGRGSLSAAVGTILGTIVLFILVAIGLGLGTAVGQPPAVNTQGVSVGAMDQVQQLATMGGIAYLLTLLIIGAIAGALVGAAMPSVDEDHAAEPERRPVRSV